MGRDGDGVGRILRYPRRVKTFAAALAAASLSAVPLGPGAVPGRRIVRQVLRRRIAGGRAGGWRADRRQRRVLRRPLRAAQKGPLLPGREEGRIFTPLEVFVRPLLQQRGPRAGRLRPGAEVDAARAVARRREPAVAERGRTRAGRGEQPHRGRAADLSSTQRLERGAWWDDDRSTTSCGPWTR